MRKPPKWVEQICAEFGKDPIYGQQRYRVIWGPDREEIRYGQVCKRYDDVDPRWILEVFVPHEKFGAWDEESMGPRPSGGEYWLSQIIQVEGLYISMSDYGRETLKLLITVVEKGKALSEWEKKRWREQQEEKRRKAWAQKFSDIYDEVSGPFGENAVAGIPGKRRSDDVVLGDLSQLSPELRARLATKPGEFKQL
ncbi:MAG TPA: hypothetical protein VMG31_03435 [Verrucomicrobiae bacterium]|nr:hypothetical protein [Verrucomicrobiae bacterium]